MKDVKSIKRVTPENFDDGLTQVAPKGEFKSILCELCKEHKCNPKICGCRCHMSINSAPKGCGKEGIFEGMKFHCNGILLCPDCKKLNEQGSKT